MTIMRIAPGGRLAMCHNCRICDSDLPVKISTAYALDRTITEENGVILHGRLIQQQIRHRLLNQRMVRQRSRLQLRREQHDLGQAHIASLERKVWVPRRRGEVIGHYFMAAFMLLIVLLICQFSSLPMQNLCKTVAIT